CTVSARWGSSVTLPSPCGRIRRMRSFSSTVKLTPSNSGCAPNDAVSCWASRRIAMAPSGLLLLGRYEHAALETHAEQPAVFQRRRDHADRRVNERANGAAVGDHQ